MRKSIKPFRDENEIRFGEFNNFTSPRNLLARQTYNRPISRIKCKMDLSFFLWVSGIILQIYYIYSTN